MGQVGMGIEVVLQWLQKLPVFGWGVRALRWIIGGLVTHVRDYREFRNKKLQAERTRREERLRRMQDLRATLDLVLTERRLLTQGLTTAVEALRECDNEAVEELILACQLEQGGYENAERIHSIAALVPRRARPIGLWVVPETIRDPGQFRVSPFPDETPRRMFDALVIAGAAYLQDWLLERNEPLVALAMNDVLAVDEYGEQVLAALRRHVLQEGELVNRVPLVFAERTDLRAIVGGALDLLRRVQAELQRALES